MPFFGVAAATVDAAPRIARATGARLLFMEHWRETGSDRWILRFRPVPTTLPSGDARADTARLLRMVEDAVRERPSQYLWTHRRWKHRPRGEELRTVIDSLRGGSTEGNDRAGAGGGSELNGGR